MTATAPEKRRIAQQSPSRRLAGGIGVLVALAAAAGLAFAAIDSVDGPAIATSPAGRVRRPPAPSPIVGGCAVFPPDNAWNLDISAVALHPKSDSFISRIQSLGGNQTLHADFGGNGEYGIPFVVVP